MGLSLLIDLLALITGMKPQLPHHCGFEGYIGHRVKKVATFWLNDSFRGTKMAS